MHAEEALTCFLVDADEEDEEGSMEECPECGVSVERICGFCMIELSDCLKSMGALIDALDRHICRGFGFGE